MTIPDTYKQAVQHRRTATVPGVVILLMGAVVCAQTGTPGPTFEVASVKPKLVPRGLVYMPLSKPSKIIVSGTRVTTQGALFHLVAGTYGVQFYQVAIGPDWSEKWASAESYEVDARAPGETPPTGDQVRAMMQTLLVDRFQLKVHREFREMPVYYLAVGSGGAKIKPSSATELSTMEGKGSSGSQIHRRYTNFSVSEFIAEIMGQFDRPLLDKTGLTGGFDFSLDYRWQAPGMTSTEAVAIGAPDPEPGLPIVASIQAQLGLRVVPARAPVEILVIDHAEKPSAN